MIDIKELRKDKRPQSSTVVHALIDRLEAAEKERDTLRTAVRHESDCVEAAKAEIKALQAKIEAMEKQEPAAWCATDETGTVVEALGMNQSRRFDTALYLASGAKNVPKAVAYLDLGTGGYMDIGTNLTDEALAALPKGRHMLGIVGTYGVEGYVQAQPAPSVPDVDALAQFIREVDGSHQLGAGVLAERISEWLKAAPEAKV